MMRTEWNKNIPHTFFSLKEKKRRTTTTGKRKTQQAAS
jgi:hypothetical protein